MFVIALSFASTAHAQDAVGYMVANGPDVTFSVDGSDGDVIGTVYEAGRNERVVEVDDQATSLDSIRDDDPFAYRAMIGWDGATPVATVYNERGWEMMATIMESPDGGPVIVTDTDVLYDIAGRASGMLVPLDQMLMGVIMYNTDDETVEMHLDRFSFSDAEELLAQARGLGI